MINYFRLIIIILATTACQAQTPWQVNVGSVGLYPYNDIYENYDRGLMILSTTIGQQKYSLIKTDANGKVLYNRFIKYENPKGNKLSVATIARAAPAKDGGVLLCGGLYPTDTFDKAFIAKLDACGDVTWSYIFDDNISQSDGKYIMTVSEIDSKHFLLIGEFIDYFIILTINDSGTILNQSSIQKTLINYETIKCTNGDFLTEGGKDTRSFTDSADTLTYYLRSMLVRTDPSGNLKWYNTYGLTDDSLSLPNHIIEGDSKNKDIYIFGNHLNPLYYQINLTYLKKCDSMGNQIWHKNMGQQLQGKVPYFEEPQALLKLKDGNILLLESRNFGKYLELSFARMIKVNPNGDVLDSNTLGDSANFFDLTDGIQTYDSNIVVASSYFNTNRYNGQIHLRKFDYNMKQVNMTTTNFKYDSLCPHAVRTDDIDLSNSKTIPFILDTTHLHKSHKYYTTVTAIPTVEGKPQIKVWPNPFDTWLKVSMPIANDITTAELHHIDGKLIWNGRVYANGMIETGQLPSGIYVLSLYNRNGDKWDAKVIKE